MDTLSQLFGVKHDLPGQFAGNNESEGIGDKEGRAEEDLGEEGPEGPHLREG